MWKDIEVPLFVHRNSMKGNRAELELKRAGLLLAQFISTCVKRGFEYFAVISVGCHRTAVPASLVLTLVW